MQPRTRSTALTLAWTLAACHKATTTTPVDEPQPPGPITELEGDGAVQTIELVPQAIALLPDEWTFAPDGRRFASTELGDCSVWDIESSRLIRSFDDDAGPCEEWQPASSFDAFVHDDSADGLLTAEPRPGAVDIVEVESGRVLRSLACRECADADLSSWSLQGHQLAFAWQDPPRVDIWDADAGKRVSVEAIPLGGELTELELGWTEAGATVLWSEQGFPVECEEYSYEYDDCEFDEDEQKYLRRPASAHMLTIDARGSETHDVGHEGDVDELRFDPSGHWAFWVYEWSERRGGTTTELHFVDLVGDVGDVDWEDYEDYDDYDEVITIEGEWRDDGVVHWLSSVMLEEYDGNPTSIEWQTEVLSPPLGRRTGTVITEIEYDAEFNFELFGVTAEGVRFVAEVCNESCAHFGPIAPPDCTIVDIGSGHGAELLDCGSAAVLRNSGGSTNLPVDPAAMQWWWSRGGALALHDGDNFMIVDAAGGTGKQRKDVTGVLTAHLGPELDRLLITTDAGVELIDLQAGGKPLMSLPGVAPIDAALSPTGDRLALLDDKRVRVLAVPSGEQQAAWSVEAAELAFRQDGKVIYTGSYGPELAFDAASGQKRDDPVLERILTAYDGGGELDPTWRWIMNEESQQLTRTLDGLTLEWTYDGAWLPSTGQYVGAAPGAEVAFRVGSDPWAVPRYDAKDLARWLQRPDLVGSFLLGRQIPAPRLSAGEFAALQAKPAGEAQ